MQMSLVSRKTEGRASVDTGRSLGQQREDDARGLVSSLTARELQVLSMIAAGLANKVIASQLGISETTMKTHANRVFRKLSVTNRVLAARAFEEYCRG